MTAPPDALALFRTVLANPADETPRLVFADWLEDSGRPQDAAWAGYLRANTLEQGTAFDPARRDGFVAGVRARLTIPASVFVRHRDLLSRLLPPKNVRVRLSDFDPHPAAVELLPAAVAFGHHLVPLTTAGKKIVLATTYPVQERLVPYLGYILNRDIELVDAEPFEVERCLAHIYGDSRQYEIMDSNLAEFHDPFITFT
jgi:uncharacterized protein (TIGR02996 family)